MGEECLVAKRGRQVSPLAGSALSAVSDERGEKLDAKMREFAAELIAEPPF